MTRKFSNRFESAFERFALKLSKFAGGTAAFVLALSLILLWGVSGPIFNYSLNWQMTMNTASIITFLMVFLIQRGQNKDSLAIQMKLNEIIASMSGASNRLIDVENLDEKDLELMSRHYSELAMTCEKEFNKKKIHSIEEAVTKNNLEFTSKDKIN